MSNYDDIAIIYANSFYQVSKEENQKDLLFSQMMQIKKILLENLDLIRVLNLPNVGKKEKKNIVENVFSGKLSDYIVNFFKILIDNNKTSLIFKIIEKYKFVYYKENNFKEVTIISAIDLNELQKNKILCKCEKLFNKKIITNYLIDEEIMGGFIIKSDDKIVDMSVKNKLNNMKNTMLNVIMN